MRKILVITGRKDSTGSMYEIKDSIIERISKNAAGFKVIKGDNSETRVKEKISEAEIIITSSASILNTDNCKKLKWLHLTSAGANGVPEFIWDTDILVTNSSGVHPVQITEHVLAFMLMFARGIEIAYRNQIEKKEWVSGYDLFSPFELFGKSVLIVGMGKIGERIGKICHSFGMDVSGLVRDISKKRKIDIKVKQISDLKNQVTKADFVVNCLPGTIHTDGLFDKSVFKCFKRSAYFINIGRGTSVVEQDLIEALETGKIAGAGLDVFTVEPLPKTSSLWVLKNVIITPHYSGWSPQYFDRVIDIFLANLRAYLRNEKLPNLVNKELGY